MFDSLVEFKLETYELEPALAASWDISDDGTVYTFNLREGVTWSDGEPFTADDVIFTYEQVITNPEARAGDAAQFVFVLDGQEENVTFEKVDDLTVRMTLPTASAAFLLQQRFFIMPEHKLEGFSVQGGAEPADINNAWPTDVDPSEVVGTGPYTLQNYTPGQLVTLQKNPELLESRLGRHAAPLRRDDRVPHHPRHGSANGAVFGGQYRPAQHLGGAVPRLQIERGGRRTLPRGAERRALRLAAALSLQLQPGE